MSKTITISHETGQAVISRNCMVGFDYDQDACVLYMYPGMGMKGVIEVNGVALEEAQRVMEVYAAGLEEDAAMYQMFTNLGGSVQ